MGRIVSINRGKCVDAAWATRRGRSAIEKLAVESDVAVTELGLAGDEQAADFHGGVLQAVYAYSREDLDWWSGQLGRPLRDGMFGENIDIVDFDVSGAVLGEQWSLGEVLLEVTAPRMACGTFGAWMGEKGWAKRFNDARRPGAYLRVLRTGRVSVGERVEVVHRPARHVTVSESVGAIMGDEEILRRVVAMADSEPDWDRTAMMFHVSNRTRHRAKLAAEQAAAAAGAAPVTVPEQAEGARAEAADARPLR